MHRTGAERFERLLVHIAANPDRRLTELREEFGAPRPEPAPARKKLGPRKARRRAVVRPEEGSEEGAG